MTASPFKGKPYARMVNAAVTRFLNLIHMSWANAVTATTGVPARSECTWSQLQQMKRHRNELAARVQSLQNALREVQEALLPGNQTEPQLSPPPPPHPQPPWLQRSQQPSRSCTTSRLQEVRSGRNQFRMQLEHLHIALQQGVTALHTKQRSQLVLAPPLSTVTQCETPTAATQWSLDANAIDALELLARVQRLVLTADFDWHGTIGNFAEKVATLGNSTRYVTRLRAIQSELARLPPSQEQRQQSSGRSSSSSDSGSSWRIMRPLIMTMVNDSPDVRAALRLQMSALPCNYSVYHFDAKGPDDAHYRAYAAEAWYSQSAQVVRRAFVTGTGCQVEAIKEVLAWLLGPSHPARGYTHLWLLDSDIDFRLFSYPAFKALVSYRRPFLCQPAMLPTKRGRRATDRYSLKPSWTPSLPSGRERCKSRARPIPVDDIDNQPLIDAALFAPLYAAIKPLDTRNQVSQAQALNAIARAFGEAAASGGEWPPPREPPHYLVPPTHRPAGLVFDWTPVIHLDTRLLGWGQNAYKKQATRGGTKCPRVKQGPPIGEWRTAAEPVLRRLRQKRAAPECGAQSLRRPSAPADGG